MESTTRSTLERTRDRLGDLAAAGAGVVSMSDDELVAMLEASHQLAAQVDAIRMQAVREADARDLGRAVGAASTGQWVAGRLRMAPGEAGALVKLARHVDRELPATQAAFAAGDISTAHVKVISQTLQLLPTAVAGPETRASLEATLADDATTMDPVALRRVGNHALEVIDPDLADQILEKRLNDEEAKAHRDRYLRLHYDPATATWNLKARLPKLVGEQLATVLDPVAKPQTGPDGFDTRLPEQRNADGLGELLRRWLAEEVAPVQGGNPTQVVVTVTANRTGRTLRSGIELSPGLVEQLLCEADKAYLVQPDQQPGRVSLVEDKRYYQRKLRRLLELRDGGCAFPGCDRPPGWSHAHHIQPWSKGGPTTFDNGVLLCGHHHRLVHQGGWAVRIAADGLPEFLPPDWQDRLRRPLRNTRHQAA